MARVTIDYPELYKEDVISGLRDFLSSDGEGLTDLQVSKKAILRFLKGQARPYARRRVTSQAVIDADIALVEKESAASVAVQARKDAEVSEDISVETAFGSDS